jgi:hypothetical protein
VAGPLGALLLIVAGAGYLVSNDEWEAVWTSQYPTSDAGNAGCQTCHGLSTQNLNGYGRAMQQQSGSMLARILAVASANSDGDTGGSSNLAEINAGTQPGWTSGNNTVYNRSTGVTSINQPPAGLTLDPAGQPAAPEVNVTPLTLEFGATTVGSSATETAAVQNLGTANLMVSSVTVSGNPDFSVDATSPGTPFTVPPGGSTNVVVRYTPSGTGADIGQLSITSNDSDEGTVNVTLSGTGTPPATVCDINVTPLSRDFGTVQIGQTAMLPVSIGNTGSAACSVTGLTASPAEFALGASTPALPFTVQPAASVELQINYTPVNTGADTGSLQIASTDPDESPVTVALSGTGTAAANCNIQVSAMALNFGGVPIGSPANRSTTLTNNGTANCTVNSVGLTGSPDFAINPALPSFPLTLMPGESLQVFLTYTPPAEGADTGSLNASTSDPDQPSVAVSLAGSGIPVSQDCDIQVAPLSLEFGSVSTGSNRTRSTTISNPGQAPCNVSWQLDAGGDFALTEAAPAAPVPIAPGANRVVSVRYTPSGAGDDTGTLRITSNDPDEAEVPVALSGSGFTSSGVVNLVVTEFDVTEHVRLGGANPTAQADDEEDEGGGEDGENRTAVSIRVRFRNAGQTAQPRLATVTGVQNGIEVYSESETVSAPRSRRRRGSATFPPYVPTAAGVIRWTLVIADEVPDGSTARATTEVRGPGNGSVDDDDDEGEEEDAEAGDDDEDDEGDDEEDDEGGDSEDDDN